VVADREGLGDRHEPDQTVLQPLPLLGAGSPGQDLQSLVHLQRVAGDRDRVLPPLPQQVRDRDRHPGLPHPGGPDDRDYVQAMGFAAAPASVVDVADSISTGTRSPGVAMPSKLTVLLCLVRPRTRAGSLRLGPSTRTSISRPTKRWPRSFAR